MTVHDGPTALESSSENNLHPEGRARGSTVLSEDLPRTSLPAWSRFLLPSVADLIFVLLLTLLSTGLFARKLLGDAGIGWHVRTGELILSTHSVPRVDSFSSTMNGQPWYAWEWLFDTVVAGIHHFTGLNGVVFLCAVLMAITFALVFRMMLARGANLPVAIVMLLLAVAASAIHMLTRPHIVSWLFTLICFALLEDFEATGELRRLFWLPVIMLAWVNLHGGFLVALVLQGIYLVGALVREPGESLVGREVWTRIRPLAIAGLAMLVATFVNPYGYKLHLHIYQYLSDPFLMNHINEFLSPNFHELPQKCFAVLVLLTILGVAVGRRRLGTSQLLVVCFAVYTGLFAARNIPVSSMLLVLIMAPVISSALGEWIPRPVISPDVREELVRLQAFVERLRQIESHMRGHGWPVLTVLLGIWICLQQGRLGSQTVMDAQFDGQRFPVQAVDFLERSGVHEPVFCPDSWGGYLIYRLYPQTRVAVDDRHDLYGAEFLKDYLKIVHGENQWDQALAGLNVNWVLVPKSSALASLLQEVPAWTSVYEDDTAILFSQQGGASESGSLRLPSLNLVQHFIDTSLRK